MLRKETLRPNPHTYTPSLQWKRVVLGFRELPDPCARSTWETLLLSLASKPACETELYYAVTSPSARMGKSRRLLLSIGVCPMPLNFKLFSHPQFLDPVSWPDNKRARSSELSLISCTSSDLGISNH